MRKIVLLSGLLAFAAQAADGSTSAKEAVEGFYAGLGICWDYSINKIKGTYGCAGGDNRENDWFGVDIHHKKNGKLGGTLVAGYGIFVTGNFYLGGEAMLDITGNRTTEVKGNNPYLARVKGVTPSVAVRFGGWCSPIDSLIYGKVGIAFVRTEFQDKSGIVVNNSVRKLSKCAPVVGLGIEKNVYNNINVRLEGNYRFQVKKEDVTYYNRGNWVHVENRLKGFTVRLIAVYKF